MVTPVEAKSTAATSAHSQNPATVPRIRSLRVVYALHRSFTAPAPPAYVPEPAAAPGRGRNPAAREGTADGNPRVFPPAERRRCPRRRAPARRGGGAGLRDAAAAVCAGAIRGEMRG